MGRDDGRHSGTRETSTVGERGTVVIPARLRRRFRLEKGSVVIAEARPEGVLLRPAKVVALSASELENEAKEDRHDATVLKRRAREKGHRGIPWDQVKKKHGI